MKFESIREIIVEIYLRRTLKLFTKLKKKIHVYLLVNMLVVSHRLENLS